MTDTITVDHNIDMGHIMSFNYLLLGHLLGDFILQTSRIARNKTVNSKWNLLHAVIVTISMLFFAVPFGLKTISLVIMSGTAHYFIDSWKSKVLNKSPLHAIIYFIGDQIIHISIIYLISILGEKEQSIPFINEKLIKILVVLVFSVSFMSIFIQYLLKVFFPTCNQSFFIKHEKIAGDTARLVIFLICAISFWLSPLVLMFFIPLLAVMVFLSYRKKWCRWMTWKYFAARLILDLLTPSLGFYFLIYVYL